MHYPSTLSQFTIIKYPKFSLHYLLISQLSPSYPFLSLTASFYTQCYHSPLSTTLSHHEYTLLHLFTDSLTPPDTYTPFYSAYSYSRLLQPSQLESTKHTHNRLKHHPPLPLFALLLPQLQSTLTTQPVHGDTTTRYP